MGHRNNTRWFVGSLGTGFSHPTGSSELQHRVSPNLKQRAVTIQGLRVVVGGEGSCFLVPEAPI